MNLTLPKPADGYDKTNEVETRRLIQQGFGDALGRRETITLQPGQQLVLTSPDGSQFYLTVDDSGALAATPK